MLIKINQGISGFVLLLLALCGCVLIGKEKEIAIVSIIVLFVEFVISYFRIKKPHKLLGVYVGAIAMEILFLATKKFLLLGFATILLLTAAIWNVFSMKSDNNRIKIVLKIGKLLFGVATVLVSVFLIIDLYANPITKPIQLTGDIGGSIDTNKLDSKDSMLKEIETMNSFGSRTTGSKGHNQFILWLEQKLTDMGFKVHRDTYTFDRWEEKRSAIFINNQEVHVSSAFPYSGETDEHGITGELVYTRNGDYDDAKGKIAVMEIDNTKTLPIGLIMNERQSSPQQNHVVSNDGDLVLTTALHNPKLKKAKKMGVKAVILIWKGISDEKAENQYLPFNDEYMGIPAVWVNETEGQKVIKAAKKHEQSTVILEAEKQKNALTESFYVTIEGKNKEESIIINSHTDGVNVVEENGPVGMLSMIRYLQQQQPERTMVFAFITGHFRLPDFKGTSQATSTWMMNHPELWDGKKGHMKAVAGITVEHLGSMEWKDDLSGQYEPTGKIQTEYTYAGNEMMAAIWKKAIEDRQIKRTVILRGHNKFQFGESQPLLEAGIPAIGLIPTPDYLTVDSEKREMDKFNVDLMHEQIESMLKATIIVDHMPVKQLGKSEGYSFFYGRTK